MPELVLDPVKSILLVKNRPSSPKFTGPFRRIPRPSGSGEPLSTVQEAEPKDDTWKWLLGGGVLLAVAGGGYLAWKEGWI